MANRNNLDSWKHLQEFYSSEAGADTHFQYKYIVDRLVDSEVAFNYMVGEAFVFTDPDRLHKQNSEKTIDEIYIDYNRFQRSPASFGRGLFITKGPYGLNLAKEPYVCVFINVDGSDLVAQYCVGFDVIQSHLCQPGKEIPCIISLLVHLEDPS